MLKVSFFFLAFPRFFSPLFEEKIHVISLPPPPTSAAALTSDRLMSGGPVTFHTIPRARSIPTSSSGEDVAARAASRARVFPVPVPWPMREDPAPVMTALTSAKSTLTWMVGNLERERERERKREVEKRKSEFFVEKNRPPRKKKGQKLSKLLKSHQPGDRDDVRNAAHSLAEDVVRDAEGLGDGQRGVDGVEEAMKSFF